MTPLLQVASQQQPAYLIGYSLGGPFLTYYSANYPELVAGQVYVAAAVDPQHEIIWQISHLLKYYPMR
ncbi:MAG: alpha/beta fold hydrolase [Candidatus Peribacteria bacterium]|nr:MAG: alpha/beta fold hydrolase [Candidatus Peribacteria bacterium]